MFSDYSESEVSDMAPALAKCVPIGKSPVLPGNDSGNKPSASKPPDSDSDHEWSDNDADAGPDIEVYWGPHYLPGNGTGTLSGDERKYILDQTGCKASCRSRPQWTGRKLSIHGGARGIEQARILAQLYIRQSQGDGRRDEDRQDTPGAEDDPIREREFSQTIGSKAERKKRKRKLKQDRDKKEEMQANSMRHDSWQQPRHDSWQQQQQSWQQSLYPSWDWWQSNPDGTITMPLERQLLHPPMGFPANWEPIPAGWAGVGKPAARQLMTPIAVSKARQNQSQPFNMLPEY